MVEECTCGHYRASHRLNGDDCAQCSCVKFRLNRLVGVQGEIEHLQAVVEAVREQAAYGFTGETLKNLHEGMSAQEMNSWWMKRMAALTSGEKKNKVKPVV